jgi:hypothetical protein
MSHKQRHTLTLDPDAVRRADVLRHEQSLSAFVNDALIAYNNAIERRLYQVSPPTADEQAWARNSAVLFIGEDDEDWDVLLSDAS